MFGLSKPRLFEIGVAVLLTLAALILVGWTAWAAERAISVADAWARPTAGKSRMSAAYMTIGNQAAENDRLKSASSPKAKAVELHQTLMSEEGVMQMRPAGAGLEVPAAGELVLKPGGTHLMIMGLNDPLETGAELPLTLEFERAGVIEVSVPVQADAP